MPDRDENGLLVPAVIFVGPLKTGTTWIYDYLAETNSVVLPRDTKETFFFDRYFDMGLSHYLSLFAQVAPQAGKLRPVVEVAPSYANGSLIAFDRIAASLPHVRVVITVRDPVERAVSQYWHEIRYGYYEGSLESHLRLDDPIVQNSDYPSIVRAANAAFGSQNVFILEFSEMLSDPELFCSRVCNVLGIEYVRPSSSLVGSASNEGRVPRSPRVSRLSTHVVDFMKKHQMYRLSRLAKEAGLRRLLERRPTSSESLVSNEQRQSLGHLIGFDYGTFVQEVEAYIPSPRGPLRPKIRGGD